MLPLAHLLCFVHGPLRFSVWIFLFFFLGLLHYLLLKAPSYIISLLIVKPNSTSKNQYVYTVWATSMLPFFPWGRRDNMQAGGGGAAA